MGHVRLIVTAWMLGLLAALLLLTIPYAKFLLVFLGVEPTSKSLNILTIIFVLILFFLFSIRNIPKIYHPEFGNPRNYVMTLLLLPIMTFGFFYVFGAPEHVVSQINDSISSVFSNR